MKNEQELFDEIGNVLHTHEDAYLPGAWEEFVKTKKRKRGFAYLRIAAAAAVLFIAGYVAWLFMPVKQVENVQPQTKNTPKPPYIYPKNGPGTDSLTTDRAIAFRNEAENQLPTGSGNGGAVKTPVVEQHEITNNNGVEMPVLTNQPSNTEQRIMPDDIAVANQAKQEAAAAVPQIDIKTDDTLPAIAATEQRRYDRGTQRLNYDSLANLNKPKPTLVKNKSTNAFSYGVMVSPSVGNQKMNFGTGVEVAYNINKNFAVSSGVTYARVNAGSNRNGMPAEGQRADFNGYNATFATPALASSFGTSSTRAVQSVQMALSGVELPLNFQYKTKTGFFISAGVSAMSVISNTISYDYLDSRTVSTPSAKGLSSTISVVTEKTTQQSAETVNGFIGFYTLSAGKKINLGKGKLNFAPFIKVPFNRVSSENLQLMHGGVQLGFGF